jgi:hypothetical protein
MSLAGTVLKPMGIGRMLDYSFQLYRRHFVKLFLIMLIFLGPIYLLQQLLIPDLMSQDSIFIGNIVNDIRSGAVDSTTFQNDMAYGPGEILRIFGFVLIILVYAITIVPVSQAAIVFFVQDVHAGREPRSIGQILRQSFKRFWPLVGSSLLFGFILTGIVITATILMVLVIVSIGFGAAFVGSMNGAGSQIAAVIIGVIVGIVAVFGSVFIAAFFGIKFMYYLPITAMNEESIGLGRSWKITRKSFWRLFWTMLVMYLIVYFITAMMTVILTVVTSLFLPPLVMQAVMILTNLVLAPLFMVTYAVSYFDLKVRSEGYGLEAIIQETIGEGSISQKRTEPEETVSPSTVDSDVKKED